MEWVIEFIRDFDAKELDYSAIDFVIFLGAIVIVPILFRWTTSYLNTPLKDRVRKGVNRIMLIVIYGLLALVFLNRLVTEDYVGVAVFVFFVLVHNKSYLVKKYDAFIDRLADKI
jgi:hypothetical protein